MIRSITTLLVAAALALGAIAPAPFSAVLHAGFTLRAKGELLQEDSPAWICGAMGNRMCAQP